MPAVVVFLSTFLAFAMMEKVYFSDGVTARQTVLLPMVAG
jgi:hypothetical protein